MKHVSNEYLETLYEAREYCKEKIATSDSARVIHFYRDRLAGITKDIIRIEAVDPQSLPVI